MTVAAASSISAQVDILMRALHRRSRGSLQQTLVADYSVADSFRASLDPVSADEPRPVVRAARLSWTILQRIFGRRAGLWLGGLLWSATSLPAVIRRSLHLHAEAFAIEGALEGGRILLRTGVANEPRIARWIETTEGGSVAMLQAKDSPKSRVACLRHLPRLARVHARLCVAAIGDMDALLGAGAVGVTASESVVPAWFVLLGRRSVAVSWNYVWASAFLGARPPRRIYFTMNHSSENAFRLALPGAAATYVEHGFPRRDIPPLPCAQYVYSEGHARYLRTFDETLEISVIGLAYFERGRIEPKRTIVIASLQDWPRFRIAQVAKVFNAALAKARELGWSLVFRTRSYDSDAFARALDGPWDDMSHVHEETFQECLARCRPAMVWTTWSTAVLDAAAQGVAAVAFVTADFGDHFIADLEAFAFVVPRVDSLDLLAAALRETEPSAAMAALSAGEGPRPAQGLAEGSP